MIATFFDVFQRMIATFFYVFQRTIATLATNWNSLQKHWLWWTMVEVPWRASHTMKVVWRTTVTFLGWTPLWLALCVHKVLWLTSKTNNWLFLSPLLNNSKLCVLPIEPFPNIQTLGPVRDQQPIMSTGHGSDSIQVKMLGEKE
jgi:hypothetical protein